MRTDLGRNISQETDSLALQVKSCDLCTCDVLTATGVFAYFSYVSLFVSFFPFFRSFIERNSLVNMRYALKMFYACRRSSDNRLILVLQ